MKYLTHQHLRPGKRLFRGLSVLGLLAVSLLFSGCASQSADDDGYRSSRSSVYVSSVHRSHSRYDDYYDPYYPAYEGYYYDPFYDYYYAYGSGSYGAYGHYRADYGYYCPLHHSYFSQTHYRSHDHRRYHSNVRYFDGRQGDRRRDARYSTRDRNRLIQPNTGPIMSTGGSARGGGHATSDRQQPRRQDGNRQDEARRRGSLTQAGLDGAVSTRGRDARVRDTRDRDQTNNSRDGNRDRSRQQPHVPSTGPVSVDTSRVSTSRDRDANRRVRAETDRRQPVRSTPRAAPRSEPRAEPRAEPTPSPRASQPHSDNNRSKRNSGTKQSTRRSNRQRY